MKYSQGVNKEGAQAKRVNTQPGFFLKWLLAAFCLLVIWLILGYLDYLPWQGRHDISLSTLVSFAEKLIVA